MAKYLPIAYFSGTINFRETITIIIFYLIMVKFLLIQQPGKAAQSVLDGIFPPRFFRVGALPRHFFPGTGNI